MPLVFCELALAYPPAKVSDPNQRVAAANGQFLLVEREAYRGWGSCRGGGQGAGGCGAGLSGETAKGRVALPLCRGRGCDADVSDHGAMIEGWTKNLALLFNNTLAMALWRALDIFLLFGLPVAGG